MRSHRRQRALLSRPALLACVVLAATLAACRNDDAINELREQQRLILAKLTALDQKIDKVAARSAAPAARSTGPDPERGYNLPVGTSPSRGPQDAPVTIVEFSDYQCPFCARSEPLIKDALTVYPNQTRLVYKHFPLTAIHPQALPAAIAAAAAQKQGKFWEMHEKLFANQRALAPEQIREYAHQIGLDMKKFDADIQSDEVKAAVQEDIQLGQRVGVRGTPTIFVNGKVLQNRTLEGFKQLIDPILLDAAGGQKAPNASKGS